MRAKKIAPEYDMEPFARPQAYVRLAPTESSKGGSAGQRDLDMLDMVWLKLYNKKHPDARLDDETMEDMLFEFEQQAFNGAAREKSKIEDEEIELRTDTACDVCGLLEGEPGNEMVFCDGCDTCVHQFCYGVKAIPEGDWYAVAIGGPHRGLNIYTYIHARVCVCVSVCVSVCLSVCLN